jgi:hypothetical protein
MKCQISNVRNGSGKQKYIKYADVVLVNSNDIILSDKLSKCLDYVKNHYPNDYAQILIGVNNF